MTFLFILGLSDKKEEGNFSWADGTTLDLSLKNWHFNQPDDYNENEDCVETDRGKWNDHVCENKYGFICERKIGKTEQNKKQCSSSVPSQ